MSKKLTIELPDELVAYAKAKVAAGDYGTVDEAIAAGVSNLRDEDAMIDRWVKEEVMPSYEQWVADGKPTRSSEDVFDALEERIKKRAARKAS
jgi:antitoxin ParD1/3/4